MSDKTRPTEPAAAAFPSPLGGAVVGGERPDGDEKMTPKQAAMLRTLCEDLGEEMDEGLTRAQADERIAALNARKAQHGS